MNEAIQALTELNRAVNGAVWGAPMLALILGTGVFLSFRFRFFQITGIRSWLFGTLSSLRGRTAQDGKAISQFQALSAALAASLGTGNIAGVAAALAMGGPGAVFWMWISALFGMATSFAENVLGIYYRRKNAAGEWTGGAMYYLRDGLGEKRGFRRLAKPISALFAALCVLASFGIGNMTQANSIAEAMNAEFGIPPAAVGGVLAVLTALVLAGGMRRVGRVTERMVPLMAILYIAACVLILMLNVQRLPAVFTGIFRSAFQIRAAAGGAGGYLLSRTISTGFRRGVFSNEAGLGTSVSVNACSDVREPVRQGMWGIFEVFFDTIVMCSLTAFALLSAPAEPVSAREALLSISETPQYFSLHTEEGASLIDGEPNALLRLADDDAEPGTYTELPARSVYGQNLVIRVKNAFLPAAEADCTYVNLMELHGVPGKNPDGSPMLDKNGNPVITAVELNEVSGSALAAYAFSQRFGDAAGKGLAAAVFLFAFSTIIGWSLSGARALEYLAGPKTARFYRTAYVLCTAAGSTVSLNLAWEISDTLNGLMAIPNLLGVLLLSGTAVKITQNYLSRRRGEALRPMLSALPEIQREQEEKH